MFLVGILLAQLRLKIFEKRLAWTLIVLVGALLYYRHGTVIFVVVCVTVVAIAFVEHAPRWGVWLGEISYALYLVHIPVGGRVVNLSHRFVDDTNTLALFATLLVAFALSFAIAHAFYQYVERPALRWASCIRYPS